MTPDDDTTRPPGRSDRELFRLVERRARELRFRRRAAALGSAALVLAVLGAVGMTQVGEDDRQVYAAGGGEPTTSITTALSPTSTTTAVIPVPTTARLPSTSTSRPTATATTVRSSTTTTVSCRNSHDPACGPFYFSPAPDPDRPMTVEVTVSASTVKVGEEVVFKIVRRDPDGVPDVMLQAVDLGEVQGHADPTVGLCDRFGPWDPPPKDPTAATVATESRYAYHSVGTFTATFSYDIQPTACTDSRTGLSENPYASRAKGSVQVTVLP